MRSQLLGVSLAGNSSLWGGGQKRRKWATEQERKSRAAARPGLQERAQAAAIMEPAGAVPANANEGARRRCDQPLLCWSQDSRRRAAECVGTESDLAGKAASCAGCPNQVWACLGRPGSCTYPAGSWASWVDRRQRGRRRQSAPRRPRARTQTCWRSPGAWRTSGTPFWCSPARAASARAPLRPS